MSEHRSDEQSFRYRSTSADTSIILAAGHSLLLCCRNTGKEVIPWSVIVKLSSRNVCVSCCCGPVRQKLYGVLYITKYCFQLLQYFNPKRIAIPQCNTKHATSIAIPVAILKSIAILIAIIAILQYYQPCTLLTSLRV